MRFLLTQLLQALPETLTKEVRRTVKRLILDPVASGASDATENALEAIGGHRDNTHHVCLLLYHRPKLTFSNFRLPGAPY